MSIVWDNSGNCEIFRNKDHDVLVTSMWKEDGGLRWGINRRPLVGYSYRWHPPVCKADSNAYFIIQAKWNFVGYKAPERQRQQGKKTKKQLISDTTDNSIQEHNATKRPTKRAMIMASHAKFCHCVMSHDVQQFVLPATCGDKFCSEFTLHQRKSASAHQGIDVSPQHVPETCPGNMSSQSVRFCPCYILRQYVPETCPGNMSPLLIVYLTRFSPCYILQQPDHSYGLT